MVSSDQEGQMRTTAGSKRLLISIAVAPLLMVAYLSTCGSQRMPECPHDWDFSKIRVYDEDREAGAPANPQRIPFCRVRSYKRMSPSSTTVSD